MLESGTKALLKFRSLAEVEALLRRDFAKIRKFVLFFSVYF